MITREYKVIQTFNEQGKLHAESVDIPSIAWYDSNGNRVYAVWHDNGKLHRVGGPAIISNLPNCVFQEIWENGQKVCTKE